MATDSNRSVESETDATSGENGFQPGRRKVLIGGALLIPTIVTLHGTPAWAQTDYTMTAYKYGVNKGLCRNDDPQAEEQFVDCLTGEAHDDTGGPPQPGPDVF